MAWHIERRMQSEHSLRNVSTQTVKANEKAGMVSTFSAEQKEMFQAANTDRQYSGFKAAVFLCCPRKFLRSAAFKTYSISLGNSIS